MRLIIAIFVGCLWGPSSIEAVMLRSEVWSIVIASDYAEGGVNWKLENALIDGRAVQESLQNIGAQTTLLENSRLEDINNAIDQISARAAPNDLILIYYAGHAVQVQGENYIVLSDTQTLVSIDVILQSLLWRGEGVIFVIDACRNNPFQRIEGQRYELAVRGATRSIESIATSELRRAPQGLAQLSNIRGTSALVLFSTEPGNVAADGEPGEGSIFARIFAEELERRQSVDSLVRRTTTRVFEATDGEQSPWRQGDLNSEAFLAGMRSFPVP